uniref:Uncharacterized protein n=1 Tax=Hucho hucho TaxID=62062 RepID=A0A4W5QHL8_9TELE
MVMLYYPTNRAPLLGLPGPLHGSGGWLNRSTVEAFQSYAALCYRGLGPWVSYWITINEPNRWVDAYKSGEEQPIASCWPTLRPGGSMRGNISANREDVSLALHADWVEPANPFPESHATATQRFLLFELGRFLDPLLGRARVLVSWMEST